MTRETRPSARTSDRLRALSLLVVAVLSLGAAIRPGALPLTDAAAAHAREITLGASATYVTLRSLNAFLSSAQELEVGVSLVGQGSAQPLKVLEPIDDTVERIAAVVFAVMLASGALAVAMGPLGAVGCALLSICAALGAVSVLAGRGFAGLPRQLAVYGGFLGLGLPLAFLLSAALADRLTEHVRAEHDRIVADITERVEEEALQEARGGWLAMMDTVDRYEQLARNLANRADELIGSLIGLLGVYIVRLVALPLVLIGGLFLIARRLGQGARETPPRRPR